MASYHRSEKEDNLNRIWNPILYKNDDDSNVSFYIDYFIHII